MFPSEIYAILLHLLAPYQHDRIARVKDRQHVQFASMFGSPFAASPKSFLSAERPQGSEALPEPTPAAEGGIPRCWEPPRWEAMGDPPSFMFCFCFGCRAKLNRCDRGGTRDWRLCLGFCLFCTQKILHFGEGESALGVAPGEDVQDTTASLAAACLMILQLWLEISKWKVNL